MLVYVASSWRNKYHKDVVEFLRKTESSVYDFKHPDETEKQGFYWAEIDKDWQNWSISKFLLELDNQKAVDGFNKHLSAMLSAQLFVLVLPCNRSAHLEFGWALGAGKMGIIYMPEQMEPELMYKLCNNVAINLDELGTLADRAFNKTLY